MQNIEIKAIYKDHKLLKDLVRKLGAKFDGELHQVDTYFATLSGRLKIREFINEQREAELIPYLKDYTEGPMKSMYSVLKSHEPANLKIILEKLLGTIAVVDKKREVYLWDNVRIHIDTVKNLGTFMELEAVYDETSEDSRLIEEKKVADLMNKLQVSKESLLNKSYVDYLLNNENP